MPLLDANLFPQAAEMIYNKKMSDDEKSEIKAVYIEALINFLDIFAQTEVGEGIEIDMMKVALYVNSAVFENQDVFMIKNIEDIYRLIEFEAMNGLPLWRFLKLTEYQNKIFENMYGKTLQYIQKAKEALSPCYTCIWYEKLETMFGELERCKKPSEFCDRFSRRDYSVSPENVKECDYYTSLDVTPLKQIKKLRDIRQSWIMDSIECARQNYISYNKNQMKDIYPVPAVLSDKEMIDLNEEVDPIMDLAQAFNNKRTKSERKGELRKAMYIEAAIRFFELYANSEYGSSFIPDIANIVNFVEKGFMEHKYNHINCMEDVYAELESRILNGLNVTTFVKVNTGALTGE